MDESATPTPEPTPLSAPVETAADQAVALGDVAAFKEARRAEKTPVAQQAGSRPATPVDRAASTEASSLEASEAPDPATPGKPRGTLKTRLTDVDGEIATLKAKLAERDGLLARSRESTPPPTAPSPQTPPPAPAPGLTLPADLVSYDAYLATHPTASLEEFFDARSDARQVLKEQGRAAEQRAQAQTAARSKAIEGFATRVNEHATADPEFAARISPTILQLRPVFSLQPGEQAGPGNVIAQELLSSPVAPQVMEALSDPEEFARFMAMEHPADIIRGLAKIEARFSAGDAAPPPAHKHSTTPAPVTTLGKRPTDSLPAIDAALRDGDMSAFKAARTAERAARFSRH